MKNRKNENVVTWRQYLTCQWIKTARKYGAGDASYGILHQLRFFGGDHPLFENFTYWIPLEECFLWRQEQGRMAAVTVSRRSVETDVCRYAKAASHASQYGRPESVTALLSPHV